jgi:nitrate/nitrite transport system substrate-binding protein
MKRWGQIRGDVDYAGVAQRVFLATDAAKAMRELGMTVPASASRTHRIFGRDFDPAQAEAYLNSFAIRRS